MGRRGLVRVGISGWRYPPWRGTFYPRGLPQRQELSYAASRLSTIEINGSFYSLQRPEYYAAWRAEVPAGFRFAVKGSRFVTHLKRLAGGPETLANFFASGLLALGPTLGPVLWQLPPTLAFDPGLLRDFLAALPRTTTDAAVLASRHDHRLDGRALTAADARRPVRHALEVRHPGYADPAVAGALAELAAEHDVALVLADTAGRWPVLDADTAGFRYVRLHGDEELYVSGYRADALDRWAARIAGWAEAGRDVWVYFDNDAKAHAPFDAAGLAERLGPALAPLPGAGPADVSPDPG